MRGEVKPYTPLFRLRHAADGKSHMKVSLIAEDIKLAVDLIMVLNQRDPRDWKIPRDAHRALLKLTHGDNYNQETGELKKDE